MPKTANAAMLYPGTVALTSVAKDFCQNAVSYKKAISIMSQNFQNRRFFGALRSLGWLLTMTTSARLPNFKMRPQIIAPFDLKVKSEP